MGYIVKSKKYAVGTTRKRKSGLYVKEDATHWKLLPSKSPSYSSQGATSSAPAGSRHFSQEQHDILLAAQFMRQKKLVLPLLLTARKAVGDGKGLDPTDGFKGLCKVILERAYAKGPDGFDHDSIAAFTKAFETYLGVTSDKASSGRKTLTKAFSQADVNFEAWNEFFREGGELNTPGGQDMARLAELKNLYKNVANFQNKLLLKYR